MIGVGAIYPLRISVDDHNLTVISSDAFDIEPIVVESFIINPGERFDFLLTADRPSGNYWIRAESMEVGSVSLKLYFYYDCGRHSSKCLTSMRRGSKYFDTIAFFML